MQMIHPIACAALTAALLTTVPAIAQTSGAMMRTSCSEASMKTAHDSMAKMTDVTKKAAAMKEMGMADDMMVGMKAIETRNAHTPNLSEAHRNIDQLRSQKPSAAE